MSWCRPTVLLVPLAVAALVPGAVAFAQTGPAIPQGQIPKDFVLPPKPAHPKLDSQLNRLVEQTKVKSLSRRAIAAQAPFSEEDRVAVSIYVSGDVYDLKAVVEKLGGETRNVGVDVLEAYVPVDRLSQLGQREDVLSVRAIYPPQPQVISQGAGVHGAPEWNSEGITGYGVKVGIIDVGFGGYSSLVGLELPVPAGIRCYLGVGNFYNDLGSCIIVDAVFGLGETHGTAVAEAVVDIAPDVQLYIANPPSALDVKDTVLWMASQGVDVINFSVASTYEGPGDGTSVFGESHLQSIDLAVNAGSVWVNAAGNFGTATWRGAYTDADSNGFIEFSPTSEVNCVQLEAGQQLTAQARWEDSWGFAASDLDLYLFDFTLTTPLASSIDLQIGLIGQIPREILEYQAPYSGSYCLALFGASGHIPAWVQLQAFTQQTLSFFTPAYSLATPADSASPGALAVGATPWFDTNTIEPFSSRGPTTDGRLKPDIVAADKGDSATYAPIGFAGTSQAAPHITGLAALLKQALPATTPVGLANLLKSNALPRGFPIPNSTWGWGLAQLPPLQDLLSQPASPSGLAATAQSETEILLTWTDNSHDEREFRVEVRTTGPFQDIGAVPYNSPGAVVSELAPGTTYSFRVRARNAAGDSSYSNEASATTHSGPPPPQGAPAAPSNLTATPQSSTRISLSWTDNSNNEDEFRIEIRVGQNQANAFGDIGSAPANSTGGVVQGLDPSTAYTFRVRARNATGDSPYSNEAFASTFSVDSDGDGVPDDQDRCPGFDDSVDADGDGVPDHCDLCSGFDDNVDTDRDEVPDGCDPCVSSASVACLLGDSFRVEGIMKDFSSPPQTFDARVMSFPTSRAESDQAVFFESFSPGNFEVGVKMVDACGFPEGNPLRNFWAFFGGLTNAQTEIVIEDTVTGGSLTWNNSAGEFPPTVSNVSAFPCSDGAPIIACTQDANTACLLDDRFRVTGTMLDFSSPPREFPVAVMDFAEGRAESEQAVFFESFSPGNFEIGVKMVDGCGFDEGNPLRHYWVFYGGLTNAETRIEVTQISSGLSDVWENQPGVLPVSEGKTDAFPCN